MELLVIAVLSFLAACPVNYFYWKPKLRKMDKKLFDTQKSYFRSVDIARKLRDRMLNQEEKEKKWMNFLQGED